MRGNISQEDREYIKDLEEAIKEDPYFADEIVTIGDQLMTAKQAVELLKVDGLSTRAFGTRRTVPN